MKKLLLLGICLLSFSLLKAQTYTYTSGHITASLTKTAWHDSTSCSSNFNYSYAITIDSSYVGDTVNVVDTTTASLSNQYINTTGASPWVVPVTTASGEGTDDFILSGPVIYFSGPWYKITSGADTLRYLVCYDTLLVTNPCIYGTVSGTVYIDNNADCAFDSGDVGLYPPNTYVSENLFSPAGTLMSNWGTYSTGGQYWLTVQQSWMTNYYVLLPSSYAFIFPYSPCFIPYGALTALPDTGINFPLECTSSVDVQCNALAPVDVRVNRSFYMQPYVSNTGCDTASGELKLILDSRVTYNAAMSIYPADTVNGDTLIWNYYNLTNLSEGAYWNSFLSDIYLTPDSSVAVGDTLCFSGYTNIPATDINPLNNSFSFCLPVVYSYDPNLKVVSPQGNGPQGYIPQGPDTLTYSLHFMNTGTDYAYNVNVIDTLDSHINVNTLRILGTSFNMTPQWLAPNVVEFSFNDIYLPDSTDNYAGSQGEVTFSVALNTGLAPNTQIKNTGYIYFDSNPAVVTNTTLNTIDTVGAPTQINTVTAPALKVYPNPATDVIYVENLASGTISILNINGAVVRQQTATGNLTTIDVSALPGGVYILKTVNNASTTTTKFTKY